ncbi:unnamed protein product, partial [Discosporangium mesarthrocarpum]
AQALLCAGLSASVLFTGALPRLVYGTEQNSILPLALIPGVKPALAESFNEQQRLVAETWRTVDRLYVDRTFGGQDWFELRKKKIAEAGKDLTEQQLKGTLSDMLSTLGDRYTRYLPPAKYETIVQSTTGQLAGVGLSLSVDKATNLIAVVDVEPGTPAAEAGLKAGDLLVQISGEGCNGLEPDDAASLLRGPDGSKVGIVVERTGDAAQGGQSVGEKLDLILTRRKFKVQGVYAKEALVNGQRIGVIRIKSFTSSTAADVSAALRSFRQNAGGRAPDMLLVDLRGNAGGLLPGGIDTAGLFLDAGKDVVFIIRKSGPVEPRTTAEPGPEARGPPLMVLVDGGTASAAEVFSAAVRENERAKLVGSRTFGKGVIQTVEPLSNGGGVSVTIASYETPLHSKINKVGIPVDREVNCPLTKEAALCVF